MDDLIPGVLVSQLYEPNQTESLFFLFLASDILMQTSSQIGYTSIDSL